jgi:inosine/xanthosine triphosphate pyrophosphatase family protein
VSFGEATREVKEVVSHRGRAFRALVAALARPAEG